MHAITHALFVFFAHLDAFGLLILGALDDSFLFLPLGNDLLLVALTVRHHDHLPLYIVMAAAGSTLGCYVLDLVVRSRAGRGLKRVLSPKRITYLEKKVKGRAGAVLVVASLAPPPFPFAAVIAAVSALRYPRVRMLGLIAAGRMIRFTLVGYLAIRIGRHLLSLTRSPAFEWFMIGFIAFCTAGSIFSIYKWIRESRHPGAEHRTIESN